MSSIQILWTEKIGFISEIFLNSIDQHFVREPTCLGALPPVRAPAAQGLASQTLPTIGDTECAMDKDLERDGGFFADFGDV